MTLHTSAELLSELMEEAVGHMERKAGGHPITARCGDELLLVRADAKMVVQVMVNILDNAVKYTPAGTPIRMTAERKGELAEICIADAGGGIPDGEKEKIFEKFYSVSGRSSDDRRSLGLGLFLCRAIIEAHGGTIRVEDNEPRGAMFIFTLPVEEVTWNE